MGILIKDMDAFALADVLQLPLMRTDDGKLKTHISKVLSMAVPVASEVYFSTEKVAPDGSIIGVMHLHGDVWIFFAVRDEGNKLGAMVFSGKMAGYSVGKAGIAFPEGSSAQTVVERAKGVAAHAVASFVYKSSGWVEVKDASSVVKPL